MSKIVKVLEVVGKPGSIPEGCAFAWDTSTTPPTRWYYNSAGVIIADTGASGISNPLTADLDTDGYKITNLPTPTADAEASTKKYVDDSIAAIPSGSGVTQSSWVAVTNAASFTDTAKSALQSTERVVLSGRIAFAANWGAGSSCGTLTSAHRPTSNYRLFSAVFVNSTFTDSYPVSVSVGTNGALVNASGTAISVAGYVYFDGVSFQRDLA